MLPAIVGFWKGKREWQRLVNVRGTRNVMRAALKLAVPKIVYTSTINALGFSRTETDVGDETTPYNWGPLDVSYMETKHEAQKRSDQHGAHLSFASYRQPGHGFWRFWRARHER